METKKEKVLKLLEGNKPLIADGAMGTLLHQRGANINECFDALNLKNPALVAEVHRDYINAGSNMILTNTFGANHYKLAQHGLADKVREINKAGVDLVKRVIMASFKDILIAGDVGPLGVRLTPFGRVQLEEARAAFTEQIAALVEAGVDLIIIETMTDLFEIREAVLAAKEIEPNIPVLASMTFTRDDRTLMGDPPAKVGKFLNELGVDIIGVNCAGGPNQILRLLKKIRHVVPDARFSVKPNAGFPEQTEGRVMYSAVPEYFGDYALEFWKAGACLIGGCCGTTPAHIQAMSSAVNNTNLEKLQETIPNGEEVLEEFVQLDNKVSTVAQKLKDGKFVITVEMDPPRGLSVHKILAGASLLKESGADAINVADSPMARMRMSPWAVCNLIERKVGIETILHFPTRGRNILRVQGDLLASHTIGIRNVFVVMGDPTSIGDYPDAMDNYDLVPSGLIQLIEQGFNAGLDHAGATIGQPTSFFVGTALNLNPVNPQREYKVLRRKLEAGADFVLTQPVYETDVIKNFLKGYEETYGKLEIPLLVGILPLASYRHAVFLQNEVPGIVIPEEILTKMKDSEDQSAATGIKIAIELGQKIKQFAQGIYIMPPFHRFDYAAEIVEALI